MPNARQDTYKGFREWLDEQYPSGRVSNEEWEQLILEDSQFDYISQSPAVGISYDILESGDDVLQQTDYIE